MPVTMLSVRNIVIDRSVRAFRPSLFPHLYSEGRGLCYAASRGCVFPQDSKLDAVFGRQQRIDVRRTHHCSIIYKSLMVALDRFDVVEVVHHDAERFLDAARRGVAEPVDLLEPRAVAEMKTRYRVDAVSGRCPSRQVGLVKTSKCVAPRL